MTDTHRSQSPCHVPSRPERVGFLAAVALAGAIYPLLAYFGFTAAVLVSGDEPSIEFNADLIGLVAVAALTGSVIATTVGIGSLVLAIVLRWTLAPNVDGTRTATFAGGLLGLLLLCVALHLVPNAPRDRISQIDAGLIFLLGPCLATPLFQFAAAWGEWPREGVLRPQGRWQFSMRQILATMVWMALGLTLLRFTGLVNEWVLTCVALWGVYQTFTIISVWRFCRWWFGRGWKGEVGMAGG